MSETLTLDEAAAGTDLIEMETGGDVIAHDPGTLEAPQASEVSDPGNLTLDQAVALSSDDLGRELATPQSGNEPVVRVEGHDLTLNDIGTFIEGAIEGRDLKATVGDIHARYDFLVEAATDIAYGAQSLADYLATEVVPEPSVALAQTDPGGFVRQQAMHEAGLRHIGAILSHAHQARRQADAVNVERHQQILAIENQKLVTHFPQCAEPEGREAFFDVIRQVGYDVGFTEDELRRATDHRLFKLAHLAATAVQERDGQFRQKIDRRRARRQKPAPKPRPQSLTMDEALELVD